MLPAYPTPSFEHLCAVISALANGLLLLLIIFRTSRDQILYKRMFLSNCLSNLVFAALLSLTRTRICYTDGNLLVRVISPFNAHTLLGLYVQALAPFCLLLASVFVATVPFLYRYFIVCRRFVMAYQLIALLMAVESLLAAGMLEIIGYTCWPYVLQLREHYWQLPSVDSDPNNGGCEFLLYRIGDKLNRSVVASVIPAVLFIGINGVLIVAVSYKVWRRLRLPMRMNKKLASLSRQINTVLTIAVAVPLSILALIVASAAALYYVPVVANVFVIVMNLAIWTTHLMPIVNPVCTLYFVKAYREALVGIVGRVRTIRQVTQVQPIMKKAVL